MCVGSRSNNTCTRAMQGHQQTLCSRQPSAVTCTHSPALAAAAAASVPHARLLLQA